MQLQDETDHVHARKLEELQSLVAELARQHAVLQKTGAELHTSNVRLAEAQAVADIGSWELDPVTDDWWWSDQIFRIFEIDPNESTASYAAFLEPVHPEDRGVVDKAFRESVRNQSSYDLIYRLLMKDGRIKYVREHCKTICASDGSPQRIIGTVQNITRQQEMQDALTRGERRFRSIFEMSPTGMVIVDHDMSFQVTNRAFQQMMGYSAGELQGMSIVDFTYPDDREKIRTMVDDLCSSKRDIYCIEKRCLHKQGHVVWTLTSAAIVPGYANEESYCLGIIEDISGLKNTEASLREAQDNLEQQVAARTAELRDEITLHKCTERALREHEAQFRSLVENIPGTVFRCVLDDAYRDKFYISEAVEELSGYPASDFINRVRTLYSIIHPDDLQRVDDIIQKAARESGRYATEFRVIHSTGEVRWVHEKGQVYISDTGIPLWIDGAIFDTTLLKAAEEERLRHAEEQRNALIREVHHRIKNNLQGVIGLLGNQMVLHPEVANYLGGAIIQLQSVALVFGLQGQDEKGSIKLGKMIRAIIASIQSYMQAPITLVEAPERHASVKVRPGEAVALALVVNELLLNASKHRGPGAGETGVTVTEIHDVSGVELVFVNFGHLPPGFDFPRGKGLGTGLGLVKSLLPRVGISVDISEAGSQVTVRLHFSHPLIEIGPDNRGLDSTDLACADLLQ
jgi:PAS domain S-box-containing protein